jgi:DNA replication initiation complex subunit (GINS family)
VQHGTLDKDQANSSKSASNKKKKQKRKRTSNKPTPTPTPEKPTTEEKPAKRQIVDEPEEAEPGEIIEESPAPNETTTTTTTEPIPENAEFQHYPQSYVSDISLLILTF